MSRLAHLPTLCISPLTSQTPHSFLFANLLVGLQSWNLAIRFPWWQTWEILVCILIQFCIFNSMKVCCHNRRPKLLPEVHLSVSNVVKRIHFQTHLIIHQYVGLMSKILELDNMYKLYILNANKVCCIIYAQIFKVIAEARGVQKGQHQGNLNYSVDRGICYFSSS